MRVKRLGTTLAYAFALALFCAAVYVHFQRGYYGDKNMRLWVTNQWLAGRALYSGTYFDVNLPLSIWIYSLPVRLAHILSVKDYHMLVLFGMAFAVWSMAVALKLMQFHPAFKEQEMQHAFLVLLCFVCIFYPSPSLFFEREFIFLTGTLPYLLRWMPSLEGAPLSRSLRLQVGLLGAIGFCVKPHCMLLLAGIQLLFLLRNKSLRILFSLENIIIYCAGICYVGIIWLFLPDYWKTVLPMAMDTYRNVQDYLDGRIFYMILSIVTFALLIVDFRPRYTSPYRRDIYYLLCLCPFLVAYVFFNNGWTTTYYPLMSLIIVLAAMLRWEALWLKGEAIAKGQPFTPFKYAARACMVAIIINALWAMPGLWGYFTYSCEKHVECKVDNQLRPEVQGAKGLRSFGTMSSVYGRWIELSRNTGAKLETRFHQLWMLQKFEAAKPAFYVSQSWVLTYVANAYAEDISAHKPDIIFVDDYDVLKPEAQPVTLPDYFSRTPAFKTAWAAYRFDHTVDYCTKQYAARAGCRFDAYLRMEP